MYVRTGGSDLNVVVATGSGCGEVVDSSGEVQLHVSARRWQAARPKEKPRDRIRRGRCHPIAPDAGGAHWRLEVQGRARARDRRGRHNAHPGPRPLLRALGTREVPSLTRRFRRLEQSSPPSCPKAAAHGASCSRARRGSRRTCMQSCGRCAELR
eukprot:693741-Rhodomonas_salina.1